jgi:hypothetical protein
LRAMVYSFFTSKAVSFFPFDVINRIAPMRILPEFVTLVRYYLEIAGEAQ